MKKGRNIGVFLLGVVYSLWGPPEQPKALPSPKDRIAINHEGGQDDVTILQKCCCNEDKFIFCGLNCVLGCIAAFFTCKDCCERNNYKSVK